jgi:hypothetical protein
MATVVIDMSVSLGDTGLELELLDVIDGPGATHLRYAVQRPG